jgi:hypothetical protein
MTCREFVAACEEKEGACEEKEGACEEKEGACEGWGAGEEPKHVDIHGDTNTPTTHPLHTH